MPNGNTGGVLGHGIFTQRITGVTGVHANSRIVASITELTRGPGGPAGVPHIGDASMQVLNIASPGANPGEIFMKINIQWDSDLFYRIAIFWEN